MILLHFLSLQYAYVDLENLSHFLQLFRRQHGPLLGEKVEILHEKVKPAEYNPRIDSDLEEMPYNPRPRLDKKYAKLPWYQTMQVF